MALRLAPSAANQLYAHYTGNCTGCPRCDFYLRIEAGEAQAVAEYVRYMRETEGKQIKVKGKPD